jgi:O-glycosyl hydrolase
VEVYRSDNITPEEAALQLMVSAYKHAEDKKLAVLFVNYGYDDQRTSINFKNAEGPSEFIPYLTSDKSDLEKQTPITQNDSLIIPARSIITLSAHLN